MRTSKNIRHIYIEEDLVESVVGRNVLAKAGTARIEVVPNGRVVLDRFVKGGEFVEKDSLLVYKFPGKFVSSCPGSDGMVCCQYFVINFGVGCLFDCHYCYLQSFVNNPLMTVFGNLDDLFAEIDQKISGKKFQFRIGTGEYTDSLALEDVTGISRILVEHFAGLPNATLELKTKSSNVAGILDASHKGHTVVAWSVNPQRIVDEVEDGTATLDERLTAAEQVQRAGYRIAFHLDPVIHFDGWEREYHDLIDHIFSRIRPDNVAWISLGGFRFSPGLKETMQARFPQDRLTKEEMIQGPDGKYRYFKTIREEMYASIRAKIESVDPRLFLYLCMETRGMWEKVFDFVPDSSKNLDALFEKRRNLMDELTRAR